MKTSLKNRYSPQALLLSLVMALPAFGMQMDSKNSCAPRCGNESRELAYCCNFAMRRAGEAGASLCLGQSAYAAACWSCNGPCAACWCNPCVLKISAGICACNYAYSCLKECNSAGSETSVKNDGNGRFQGFNTRRNQISLDTLAISRATTGPTPLDGPKTSNLNHDAYRMY